MKVRGQDDRLGGVLKKLHKLCSVRNESAPHAAELLRVATEMRWMTVFEAKSEETADSVEEKYRADVARNFGW
ncbi:MAG: hypothetical protein O3A82_16750 [Verrucomicrobia bacterium]|nr:hypothetical protein [Verrucomicrobiota bacterium]MDA1048561.1 hypothetical protein [Verrucomicrobiota bacterium]